MALALGVMPSFSPKQRQTVSSSATHRTRHTILSKYLLVDMILTHIIAVIADESGVFHSRHFRKRVYEIGAFVL